MNFLVDSGLELGFGIGLGIEERRGFEVRVGIVPSSRAAETEEGKHVGGERRSALMVGIGGEGGEAAVLLRGGQEAFRF